MPNLSAVRRRLSFLFSPELEPIYRERNRLRDLNADLHHQNEQLRQSKPMTHEEWEQIARIKKEHGDLVNEQNKITLWLRDRGTLDNERFAGLSFSQLIIHLLGGK